MASPSPTRTSCRPTSTRSTRWPGSSPARGRDVAFSSDDVRLGARAGAEIDRICAWLRDTVLGTLRRRGVVLGLSGGIDSSVVAALAARALGADKVLCLF